MNPLTLIAAFLIFPLFLVVNGMAYEWVDRKLLARMQNRVGPRWFQPLADIVKLFVKEEVIPEGSNTFLFNLLPVLGLAAVLTAALAVPVLGIGPLLSFPGDLIVTLYLLSLLTLAAGIAGQNTSSHFAVVGSARLLTQLFAYEAPYLLALLGPAFIAGSWQLNEITAANAGTWVLLAQPIGFFVAVMSLMGKLELPPFDAPEAETEIVAGSLTEYGSFGLALFMIARKAALVVSLTLIAALFMGGIANPLDYLLKTGALLLVITGVHAIMTRLRIDQTVGLWWRWGMLLMLAQWFLMLLGGL
jgi:NADH-quinone oxidoreductase subunit H